MYTQRKIRVCDIAAMQVVPFQSRFGNTLRIVVTVRESAVTEYIPGAKLYHGQILCLSPVEGTKVSGYMSIMLDMDAVEQHYISDIFPKYRKHPHHWYGDVDRPDFIQWYILKFMRLANRAFYDGQVWRLNTATAQTYMNLEASGAGLGRGSHLSPSSFFTINLNNVYAVHVGKLHGVYHLQYFLLPEEKWTEKGTVDDLIEVQEDPDGEGHPISRRGQKSYKKMFDEFLLKHGDKFETGGYRCNTDHVRSVFRHKW